MLEAGRQLVGSSRALAVGLREMGGAPRRDPLLKVRTPLLPPPPILAALLGLCPAVPPVLRAEASRPPLCWHAAPMGPHCAGECLGGGGGGTNGCWGRARGRRGEQ